MGLLDTLRGLFRKKQAKQNDDDMPYSIVLLLRSPFALTQETLEAAATRAYGVPYDGSDDNHFAVQNPAITIVKAGKLVLSILQVPEPYMGDPEVISKGFRDPRASEAWREHRSWAALDLRSNDVPEAEAYAFLAALASELLDVRSAGIYLPKISDFWLQSDGTAAEKLKHLRTETAAH
jgi:hypothetical protein